MRATSGLQERPNDSESLELLQRALEEEPRPRLVGGEGTEIELPDPVFHHLLRLVGAMRRGERVVLVPEDGEMTTQGAADFLGVSRPFLIKLLTEGEIPFHRAGSHRRIAYRDLRTYAEARDRSRRERLDALFDDIAAEGLYDAIDESVVSGAEPPSDDVRL